MINRVLQFIKGYCINKVSLNTYLQAKKNRNSAGSTRVNGIKFSYAAGNIFLAMYQDIFVNKIYNFTNDINEPKLILDCGANIGIASIYFARRYSNAKIIAFEPDEKNLKIFEANVSDNNLKNVSIIKKAIWINNDGVAFDSGNDLRSKIDNSNNKTAVLTKTQRLQEILQNEDSIDFLKLDIEGAEMLVIEDCKDEIYKIKKMFIEYHSDPKTPQELHKILQILTNANFRYYINEDCSLTNNPLLPINPIWGFDLQLQIFAYK
jgi:FkbM family methyltransferase